MTWRARLGHVRATIADRPWHLALSACVVGLVAGPRAPLLVLAAAAMLPLLARRPVAALAALAALFGGALLADGRLRALDTTALGPSAGHVIAADTTLLETPRAEAHGTWRAMVLLHGERVLLRSRTAPLALSAGDGAAVHGVLRRLGPPDRWLRTRHARAVLDADSAFANRRRRAGPAGALDGMRRRAQLALKGALPPPEAALLRGMVLGDDALMPKPVRDELRRAGLGHLVAASGANIALLAILGMAAGAALGVARRTRLLVVLGLVAGYVPLAGSGASIQRAGVMGAAGLIAALASRPAARWYALLLAAAVTLALDPLAADDPGWQLSFAAVIAIAVLAAPLRERLTCRGIPRALAELIAVTLAASIGTAPVSVARFGTLSLAAIPANVVVAPVVAPITWLGMVAALAGQIDARLAGPFVALAGPPLAFVTWVGHVAAGLPGAALHVPVLMVAVVTIAAGAAIRSGRAGRALLPVVPAAVLAAVALIVSARGHSVSLDHRSGIAFLNIGQGDATLLFTPGHAVLIDSGPPDGPILERLAHLGVHRLDVLAATHAQADHDGGAAAVLRSLPVGAVLDGRDGAREPHGTAMALAAATKHVRLIRPLAGQTIRAGPIELHILWPPATPPVPGADPNQRAIVAVGAVGGIRILLTADAESDVLLPLDLPRVDVLKVSHHGSADTGLAMLLARLKPRLGGIEVGAGNTYGHPTPATLNTLRDAGVPSVRTDQDGTVIVTRDAGQLLVQRHS